MFEEKHEKIDLADPSLIAAFIAAFMGDFTFFLIVTHYFFGAMAIAFVWGKTKGWLAKLILITALLLPGPILMMGIALAILASNKFIAFLVEQAAIQGISAVTAGGGEALEGLAVAEVGAEAAEVGVEAAATAEQAGAAAAELEESEEAGRAAKKAADELDERDEDRKQTADEALGERPEPMDELQQQLTEESPEDKMIREEDEQEGPEKEEETTDERRLRKAHEQAQHFRDQLRPQGQAKEDEDEQNLAA